MKSLRRLCFENTGTLPSAVDLEELYELLKEQQQRKKRVGFGIYNQNTESTWKMIQVGLGVIQRVVECCC